jgi:hypothetical protein
VRGLANNATNHCQGLGQSCPASYPRFLLLPPVRSACAFLSPSLTSTSSPHTPSQPQPSPSHAPSPLSTNQNRRPHRRAIFPHAAKDQWATFLAFSKQSRAGLKLLNWVGNLDSPSPLRQSTRTPSRHLQLQSRLRGHLYSWPLPTRKGCVISTPLARKFLPSLHPVNPRHFWWYHGMWFPSWHISLPLQGPNIRFPCSHLCLHSNVPLFFVANGSPTPTSFSLSLVSLSVHQFSHPVASARPYTKSSSPVQFFTQHKYWCLIYQRRSTKNGWQASAI